MGWTRESGRVARDRRRPLLEALESRQLLSTTSAQPASGPNLNGDGSTNFDAIINASAARAQFHLDGTGQSVAVIDTGVDYNHEALGGGFGPGHKVVAGVDFTGSPNGVLPTWPHGTGVAGLVASSDPNHLGIAPGADVVALRVFNDNNQGSFSEIADALNWVVQNHAEYNITVVNLSVSDGGVYTSNPFGTDGGIGQRISTAVAQLDSLDIPVVAAAGNSFDGKTQGDGFPSIIPDAVSVTATDASDKLASNAQRLGSSKGGTSATTVAAPGIGITAPSDGTSNFTTEDGTSFAAPQVSGSIILLQQMFENAYHTLPSIDELDRLLRQGAVTVHDGATGIDIGRLDVLHSAQILNQEINASPPPGSTNPPAPSPPASPTPTPTTQVFVNGVSIGNYSTAQLAIRYPSLFAVLKGAVPSIRIWVPQGTKVDLGPSTPSGTVVPIGKATKHAVHTQVVKGHSTTVGKAVPVAHHSTTHKSSNLFSSLFRF